MRRRSWPRRKTRRQQGGFWPFSTGPSSPSSPAVQDPRPRPPHFTVASVLPRPGSPTHEELNAERAALSRPMSQDPVDIWITRIGETQTQQQLTDLTDTIPYELKENKRLLEHIAWKRDKLRQQTSQQAGYRRRRTKSRKIRHF